MKREILVTDDGSVTIHLPEWNEQYHSKHGAIAEAKHVFIKNGLQHWIEVNGKQKISVMEIGLGTGLNAFLSYLEAEKKSLHLDYTGIEAYPILDEEIKQLNYTSLLGASEQAFLKLHQSSWGTSSEINKNFTLTKRVEFFSDIIDINRYNLIFFDAFGARVQPELWTESVFKLMFEALKLNGVLVTYAAKGSVRRAMQAVGFVVERLPGPPGKREMLRATKTSLQS